MAAFPLAHNNLNILVAVDYVSKRIKAIVSCTNDSKVVIKFLKRSIFI